MAEAKEIIEALESFTQTLADDLEAQRILGDDVFELKFNKLAELLNSFDGTFFGFIG